VVPTTSTQLLGFARGTPAGPILLLLARAPWVTGVGIALLEIAIGLGTLVAIAPMASALGGSLVSLTLLSVTWHVHPYFLGSDSIYAVAWLTLLAGLWETERARTGHVVKPLELIDGIDRREFLRGGNGRWGRGLRAADGTRQPRWRHHDHYAQPPACRQGDRFHRAGRRSGGPPKARERQRRRIQPDVYPCGLSGGLRLR
jgi:hypothetical protein